ncbi:MAG: nicotinate-nucleotide adenylyltransferase [Clostridium sp.]
MKLGIYGGTFNPIHIGHLIVAQSVLEELSLDKIIFIPTGNPPHKNINHVLPGKARMDMVNLSVSDNTMFQVSDVEINRLGKTYTYDTLIEFRQIFNEAEINFIIGYDTLLDIESWYRVEDTLGLARFVVVNRDEKHSVIQESIDSIKSRYGGNFTKVTIPNIGISSSDIRRRINQGKSIKYMVTNKVNEYIADNKLYRGDF